MPRPLKIVLVVFALALAAALSLQSGLARKAFHEVYARVAGVELLGPESVRIPPKNSPYQRWLEHARTGIPVHEDWMIPDISRVELRPWPEQGDGVRGLYLRFADYQVTDGRVLELPPGGATAGQRSFFEQGVYFLGGPGHTVLRREGAEPQRIDWQEGSLLSLPMNVRYRHFNDSDEPVRMLAVTSFPFVINMANSEAFIDDNPFVFHDRYDAAADWPRRSELTAPDWIDTNFVPDARSSELAPIEIRGAGNSVMHWNMAGNSMLSLHVSEFAPRSYKKAHRHSNDAFVLVLSGEGFSLTWPAGAWDKGKRVDWKPGTLFTPPTFWYHQHFNTGTTPARYLAINVPDLLLNLGLRFTDQLEIPHEEAMKEWRRATGEPHDHE